MRHRQVHTGRTAGKDLTEKIKAINELEPKEQLNEISGILRDIQQQIQEKESERNRLIAVRDALLERAHNIISELFMDYNRRLVMYHIMGKGPLGVDAMSEALNMREKIIRQIMKDMDDMMLF